MKTKTTKAISALDAAIAMSGDISCKRDDEFTAAEYAARIEAHMESARRMLNRMVKGGKLAIRKTSKGHFYSLPQ